MQENIAGTTLSWREAGAGDPVIFLHGIPFDSRIWDAQLAAVPDGWRFIAVDLRGFGESVAPGSEPLTMDRFADDIVALMDRLQIDQAVICGLSMGGYVALSLVRRYPDRVRALVLVATRAGADDAEAKKARADLSKKVRAEGSKVAADAMLPKLFSAHSRMKIPAEVERVNQIMQSQKPDTLARASEGMALRKDYSGELGEISVSTMVIRGEQDEIIPAADMEMIARTVRGARHEMIALTGHLPNLEAPDVVNTTLTRFLAQLPPVLKLGSMDLSF